MRKKDGRKKIKLGIRTDRKRESIKKKSVRVKKDIRRETEVDIWLDSEQFKINYVTRIL